MSIRYIQAPCPVCGARTVDEAGRQCRTTSDETGERSCRGGMLDAFEAGMPDDDTGDDAPLYTVDPQWEREEAERHIAWHEREMRNAPGDESHGQA